MSSSLGVICPVFCLILMGFGAARLHWVETAGMRTMYDFVFFAAMPCLLFSSMMSAPPVNVVTVSAVFLGTALLLFFLAVLLARTVFRAPIGAASVFALNCVFGNTVLLGLPVVQSVYGQEGVASLLAIVVFHSATLLPLTTVLLEMEGKSRGSPWRAFAGVVPALIRNPVVVSIAVAFVWRASGLAVPAPLFRFTSLVGGAASPLALFCLGATLPLPNDWTALREVVAATAIKLVVMPLLVGLFAHLAGLTGIDLAVVVMTAGMPTGANAFMLARKFGTIMETSAATVAVNTALSAVTISLILALAGK